MQLNPEYLLQHPNLNLSGTKEEKWFESVWGARDVKQAKLLLLLGRPKISLPMGSW